MATMHRQHRSFFTQGQMFLWKWLNVWESNYFPVYVEYDYISICSLTKFKICIKTQYWTLPVTNKNMSYDHGWFVSFVNISYGLRNSLVMESWMSCMAMTWIREWCFHSILFLPCQVKVSCREAIHSLKVTWKVLHHWISDLLRPESNFLLDINRATQGRWEMSFHYNIMAWTHIPHHWPFVERIQWWYDW